MAEIKSASVVSVVATFTVNESEARALDALVGYGDDAFVKAFYDKLGKAYMQEHEAGLRSFLKSIRGMIPPILDTADRARRLLLEYETERRKAADKRFGNSTHPQAQAEPAAGAPNTHGEQT